jgi:hypothetical protein
MTDIIDIINLLLKLDPNVALFVAVFLIAQMYIGYRNNYMFRSLVEALAIDGVDKKSHKLSGEVIERYGLLSHKLKLLD